MSSEPVPPGGGGSESGGAPHRRRRRRALRIGIVLAVVVAIFAGASLAAAAYTERSSFCEHACHEMEPYGATWEKSKHSDIACVHCHIKPGAVQFVKAKGSALREVWVHFTGDVRGADRGHPPRPRLDLHGERLPPGRERPGPAHPRVRQRDGRCLSRRDGGGVAGRRRVRHP